MAERETLSLIGTVFCAHRLIRRAKASTFPLLRPRAAHGGLIPTGKLVRRSQFRQESRESRIVLPVSLPVTVSAKVKSALPLAAGGRLTRHP